MKSSAINYVKLGELDIAEKLFDLVKNEIAPETDVDVDHFWNSLADIVKELGPRNTELLSIRDRLQEKIDAWHKEHRTQAHDPQAYKEFLKDIAYLVDEPDDFQITTTNIDTEIAKVAGPQLVVPLDNARYVLNAVNARWGSLYDAFYSTDTISEANGCRKIKKYNPIRGERVIERTRHLLDRHFALERDTHKHVTQYFVKNNQLTVTMGDGSETTLLKPQQFIGYIGKPENPDEVLLCHHDLHVKICFGEGFFIGRRDHAKIYDIHLESAITTIMDCEDSVASVDTEDKVKVYRNWLGLMKGTLVRTIVKDDETIERSMAPDKTYIGANGKQVNIPGRSLMLVRNVGMHLETDAVLHQGKPIPETMLDAMITTLCAKHDLSGNSALCNSRAGSVNIVKPKMHGPDEVALANDLFARVEDALGMTRNTLKMGIMDEERRTSVNLKACIHAAKERIVFINTGFLDRTGDDIHTNMEAGPVVPKSELKNAKWLNAYEGSNVQVGLNCGLKGRAQIGKGMWAMPEEMNSMMKTKIQHLKAGANTSWVPSPIAATLHAIHYHRLNVHSRQHALMKDKLIPVDDILDIPIMNAERKLTAHEIRHELENNAQGILGYVSRWVGQGVGCSKVPDINDVALMEDCATLRISSQHIANWLHHKIVTNDEVHTAMKRMAVIVDRQNRDDANYKPMAEDFESSIPFQAALDLVFKGLDQANGYTEFILYQRRREQKGVMRET
ncbi:MAG: malate synthase G [Gammaproteobacteria bacterium]|nr:malate synthase G [Gammaproteobacteria bacterium]